MRKKKGVKQMHANVKQWIKLSIGGDIRFPFFTNALRQLLFIY